MPLMPPEPLMLPLDEPELELLEFDDSSETVPMTTRCPAVSPDVMTVPSSPTSPVVTGTVDVFPLSSTTSTVDVSPSVVIAADGTYRASVAELAVVIVAVALLPILAPSGTESSLITVAKVTTELLVVPVGEML